MLIGDTPQSNKKIWKSWEKDVLRNGVLQEEIDEWYRTYHGTDYPVSSSQWLKWLWEVGFGNTVLVW